MARFNSTMFRTLATALALTALLAGPAGAQSASPAPGCFGKQVTDKSGDSANALAPDQTGNPSSDIIAGWIDYDAAANKATANVQVAELTLGEVDPPYVAISWEFAMTTKAGARFVRAYQDFTGAVKFTWGEPRAIDEDQTQPRVGGATTGELFPGPGGVIRIDIPLADIGAAPGSQLKGLAIEVRQWVSLPASVPSTGLPIYSFAPIYDEAGGRSFTLEPCPVAEAPGPVPTVPPSVPAGPSAADVTVKVGKLSARKLKRTERFSVRLRGQATDLVARLRKGRRTFGTGRLARLDGTGRLTVKLRRRIRKGTYSLELSGRDAAGRRAETAVKVRVGR